MPTRLCTYVFTRREVLEALQAKARIIFVPEEAEIALLDESLGDFVLCRKDDQTEIVKLTWRES